MNERYHNNCVQPSESLHLPEFRLQDQNCLLIKHSDGWQNDRCELWLQEQGASTKTVISHDGAHLPDPNKYDRVIVYGGIPCINDAAFKDCLRVEMQFLENALKSNTPCFGICLGAQLIAHVLGAEVKPLPCGTAEFGFSTITPTEAGKAFMPQPCNMLQWHCEGFDLPNQCQLLATSDLFPNQAFRYGNNTYGVQFHPEVTAEVLQIWHDRQSDHTCSSVTEMEYYRQRRDCKKYSDENDQWFEHFMQLWACPNEVPVPTKYPAIP